MKKRRMKLHILAGVVALVIAGIAIAGIAIAGQGKAFFTPDEIMASLTGGTASIPFPNTANTDRPRDTGGNKKYLIPADSPTGLMLIDTPSSTNSVQNKSTYLPTPDLHRAIRKWVSMNQSFNSLSHSWNGNFSADSFNSGFGGGLGGGGTGWGFGGGTGWGSSTTPFYWTLDTNGNLTYLVIAVPEPNEWLLMFFGLGLVGLFTTMRKRKVTISLSES